MHKNVGLEFVDLGNITFIKFVADFGGKTMWVVVMSFCSIVSFKKENFKKNGHIFGTGGYFPTTFGILV